MCGIGLTLFPTRTPCSTGTCIDTWCTTSDSDSNSDSDDEKSRQDCLAAAVETSLVKGIAPRGPDYQGLSKTTLLRFQHRHSAHTDTAITNTDEVCLASNDGDGDDDDDGENVISSVSLESSPSWDLHLYASVLHMRGKELTPQPYTIKRNNTTRTNGRTEISNSNQYEYSLCWNGECYSHDEMLNHPEFDLARADADGELGKENVSDTSLVMTLLQDAVESSLSYSAAEEIQNNENDNDNDNDNDGEICRRTRSNEIHIQRGRHRAVAQALSHVHGEYAFIFHCRPSDDSSGGADHSNDQGCVYFGRDPLGRRSLLMTSRTNSNSNTNTNDWDSFVLSSVGLDVCNGSQKEETLPQLEEIPAGIVYCINLNTGNLTSIPIPCNNNNQISKQIDNMSISPRMPPLKQFEEEANVHVPTHLLKAAERLHHYLSQAVRRRVIHAPIPVGKGNQARVAVLFSGGVDSVVLAALCHDHVPLDQPIDLINVAFATATATATSTVNSSSELSPSNNSKLEDPFSLSPDRQAALLSFREMQTRWPDRNWRFIAVNVDYSEVLKKEQLICGLIAPLTSTMDFNIGTAFWFASRGQGEEVLHVHANISKVEGSQHLRFGGDPQQSNGGSSSSNAVLGACSTRNCNRKPVHCCIFSACKACCLSYQRRINQFLGGRADACKVHGKQGSKKNKYKSGSARKSATPNTNSTPTSTTRQAIKPKIMHRSNARVVLVGIGADEQMAGYGRHRATFNRGGYDALRDELQMEKQRLWTRNLGRDDRCISYHGKEARFPFLDDDVVAYLNSLDVTELCDMTKPQGVGDKIILRLVAQNIGVTACSGLVKRAIQFGSRIAKCSDVDRFGSSRKASGEAQHGSSLNIRSRIS
jgi:asparagine synthetase B (glutamine-hydrolysing)